MYLCFGWSNDCGEFIRRNASQTINKQKSACADKFRGEIAIHFAQWKSALRRDKNLK